MIPAHSRSPEEWEREIEHTRARIDRTLWLMQQRMSRGAIIDRITRAVQNDGGALAVGLGRTIRDNPVPALVLGAGLAWLFAASRRASGHMPVAGVRPALRAHPSRPTTVTTGVTETAAASPAFRDPPAPSASSQHPAATAARASG